MVKKVAGIFGVVFLLIALFGFFTPGGFGMEADPARAPHVLGLFAVNLLHNIVHLLFGVWGLLAARTWAASVTYARVGGIAYLLLAVLGYFVPDGFGLVPLGGHDVWLHALIGIVLAGVGFTAPAAESAPVTTATT